MSKLYIIMGVSGSGKTTVGEALARELSLPFLDADTYHPQTNIEKMQSGQALNDQDREPWLVRLNEVLAVRSEEGAVLACSALKQSYRDTLSSGLKINWVHLSGGFELIHNRMQLRSHFMPASLLQSQFDTLEPLKEGLTLDITAAPEYLIYQIRQRFEVQQAAQWGIVGMGVMGKSLAINALNKGIATAVYNRDTPEEAHIIPDLIQSQDNPKLSGYTNYKDFTEKLERPRKILLMVPAGKPVDLVINELSKYLSPGDVLIDGGNTHYDDTQRRSKLLAEKQIGYIGMGVSGGEKGALEGPALMPGGDLEAYNKVSGLLESIAAKDPKDQPCVGYLGQVGCGHLVKTVHNGIEYAEMQLLAELYALMELSYIDRSGYGDLFKFWNVDDYSSYLMSIMPDIFNKKEGDAYLLDLILDEAAHKGTGAWTAQTALKYGQDAGIIATALNIRYHSTAGWFRTLSQKPQRTRPAELNLDHAIEAYQAARILNHLQGLRLIKAVSDDHNWNVDLAEVTRIWTDGCIIKSRLIEQLHEALSTDSTGLESWCFQAYQKHQRALKKIVGIAMSEDLPLPVHSAALQFGLAISDPNTTANIIQAQRDYFGAHTYKRKDKDPSDNFHTDWTKP